MRQIVYISTATSRGTGLGAEDILAVSGRNNLRDGVTGLLYSDGTRFLQALEGEGDAVTRTLGRIERDPRHRAIVMLSDRVVEQRDFGDWSMAWRAPDDDATAFVDRVATLVATASPSVRATFTGFAEVRRAA